MRSLEIDFTSTSVHYIDLSVGEVLAGEQDLTQYLQNGGYEENIRDISVLLREGVETSLECATIDTSEWTKEQFIAYGRWVNHLVAPPGDNERHLNRNVFYNAYVLNIGPHPRAITRKLGSLGKLYAELKVTDVHPIGVFDNWEIEDFVAYIKKVGKNRKPTYAEIERYKKGLPDRPSPEYMNQRFKEIGGVKAIIELAGFVSIESWNDDDYFDWGVRFMRANDGELPTTHMINYLSTKKLGPSARTIANRFKGISTFQTEVITRFNEWKNEESQKTARQLKELNAELSAGKLPFELFTDNAIDHSMTGSQLTIQDIEYALYRHDSVTDLIIGRLGLKETILRFARYKIVDGLLPISTYETKLSVGRGSERKFIQHIRQHHNWITPGEIEYQATVEGFFDEIWPPSNIDSLKLDKGYEFIKEKSKAREREWSRIRLRRSRAKKQEEEARKTAQPDKLAA